MLRNLAWQATDTLTRAQLHMVEALADAISLTGDDQRRALNLTTGQWSAWTDFLADDAALPAEPNLPEMLRRLAEVAFNLSTLVERRSIATCGG
ncbi:hypothetical protein [Rhodopila sp.]|uniref:hypothetical protein n=1 Tax=Rhodopila sp. TaxID=2480087 RepID=UPI003D145CA7